MKKKPKPKHMADSLQRKLKIRTIHEKYKILKEIDKRSSCASVAMNYNITEKIYATVKSNSSTKKRRVSQPPYECVDKACHTYFINVRQPNKRFQLQY